jgi:predicted NAD/FAD-dependent oxidoreductase|tara:strand:- start:1235 stop:2215 length:981 start_codon:yes stop_codon:yes gene_type:complete
MKDYCVLGSGISGSTIANLLSKKNKVEIFDKARGLGGRASNRRFKNNLSFDHGLQYITPKDLKFKKFIIKLKNKKILKIWPGKHINLKSLKKREANKYIGNKKNSDINQFLLKNIKKNFSSKIVKIKFNTFWTVTLDSGKKINFKSLILTCPFPQVKTLAKKYISKNLINQNIKMLPNITAMLVIKSKDILPISSMILDDSIIAWAANENSKKRFKSKLGLWTIQTQLKWSKKYINKCRINNKKISNIITQKFISLMNIKKSNVIHSNIHGWKYAFSYQRTKINSFWSEKYKIGICGDWFLGPKAENAWTSANDLFLKIKKNPPKN